MSKIFSRIGAEFRSCANAKRLRLWLIFGGVFLLCAFLSAIVGGSPIPFIHMLKLPAFYPPRLVFILVWTMMYAALGLAFADMIVSRGRCPEKEYSVAFLAFVFMMVFNFLWYPLFFGAKAIFSALVDLAIIIALAVLLLLKLRGCSPLVTIIVVIHIIWLAYALLLNISILILN